MATTPATRARYRRRTQSAGDDGIATPRRAAGIVTTPVIAAIVTVVNPQRLVGGTHAPRVEICRAYMTAADRQRIRPIADAVPPAANTASPNSANTAPAAAVRVVRTP